MPGRQGSSAAGVSSTITSAATAIWVAVEGGQHDLARAPVVGAVDGEQPVAQQRLQLCEAPVAPAEVGRVGHGHVVVGLGPEHEDLRHVQDAHAEHGPVALVAVDSSTGSGSVASWCVRRMLKRCSPGGKLPALGGLVRRSRAIRRTGCGSARRGPWTTRPNHTGLASQPVSGAGSLPLVLDAPLRGPAVRNLGLALPPQADGRRGAAAARSSAGATWASTRPS